MNPTSGKLTPQKIGKLIEVAYSKVDHLKRARTKFLSQYTGRWYARSKPGDAEERKASPINLIYQAVNTLVPNLVFRDPKFKVRSQVLAYRGYADMLALAMTRLAEDIGLRHELRMVIVDSLFYAGFMKTGIASSNQFITVAGQQVAVGEPFAERVDPDDMILDPMAKAWDQQMIVGNRFRVLRQDLLDSGLYEADEIQKLGSRTDNKMSFEASYLSGDKSGELREEMDFVDLAEIYIPRDQRVVTVPCVKGQIPDRFLRDVSWSGPETGPYHMLGYSFVPDNLLPIPPVSLWYDLHIMGNRIARKIARQADRLKRVLAYEGSAIQDAENIADADDGEAIKVNNLGGIKEVNYGGTTEDAYGFMEWVKKEFSDITNNLELLSGQGANAPTATQSEMLQSNSSVRLADLQNMVYDFTKEVGTDLAFFLHTDPLIELPLIRRSQGQDQQVAYTPEMRQGEFFHYVLNVQPMSMSKPDPNMKVQHLLQFATSVIPAAAQAVQVLGPAFKIQAFLERIASEIGLEEFDEIIDAPTFRDWVLTKLISEIDPAKAGMFATQQPIQSQPWQQGGQQLSIQQQVQAAAQAHQQAQAAAQPKIEPPKVSISINFADLPLDVQQKIEAAMNIEPSATPAARKPTPSGAAAGGGSPGPRINVGQPNPSQRGPSAHNINAGTEQAQAQQQVAGQLQRAYRTTSVNAQAQSLQ
jgi:hypothetical protein